MFVLPRRHQQGLLAAVLAAAAATALAQITAPVAAGDASVSAEPVAVNSNLDAPLFYQLIIGEIELRGGEPGTAFEVILDAARRTRDEALFRRAVGIALEARASEQALGATRSWRNVRPESLDALRLQIQLLLAMGKPAELAEPLRSLLRLTPADERPGLIAALPRFMQGGKDGPQVAGLIDEALKPYADAAATRGPSKVASARAWLNAGDADRALGLAREAQALDPDAPGPALLATELVAQRPEAEALISAYLQRSAAATSVRLAWVRTLTGSQRYAEAVSQLELVTRQQPDEAPPYLTLGVLHQELKHPKEAESALLRYVDLAQRAGDGAAGPSDSNAATAANGGTDDDDDDSAPARADRGLVQAWLSLAQLAEQRGDYKTAEGWLAKVADPQRLLDVQSRRASILVRQGKLAQARELIRRTPETRPEDARAKVLAETGLLRDAKRWREAFDVLAGANQRFADDADLLYEQAMMAEKLERLDDMEKLLRRVIALKPDSPHAHNALGYSLADRRQRLPEARMLIARALELSPGDPFITDSLGWVEYRMGRRDEALRLLRLAYAARPDPEIAAHLGEVLWASGQRDEARKILREGKARDGANDVLRETLGRLRIEP